MHLRFAKMHGLGNDFMVIDLVTQEFALKPAHVRRWSDRKTGIGFDQLLILAPPTDPEADFLYRISNADGSAAEQCGNGACCVARFARLAKLSPKAELRLQTPAGPTRARFVEQGVEVELGIPSNQPADLPFEAEGSGPGYPIETDAGHFQITPVSVGNPHGVLFVEDIAAAQVADIGGALSSHARFPAGANIGFCQVVDEGFIRLRVYERGAGETRACGTGACAAAVAGRLHGKLGPSVKVSLPGGKLRVAWQELGAPIRMTGPAALVFEGQIEV